MIGYLKGVVISRDSAGMIVSCSGVGYMVRSPRGLLGKVKIGVEVEVFVHTYVKEDALALYGFSTTDELRMFEKLITVSGIGPKTALLIFDAQNVSAIREAVLEADVDFFTKIPGIGKKGAQKIIIDLKSKVGGDDSINLKDDVDKEEVILALMQLGFSKQEASKAYGQVSGELSIEEKVKEALRYL